MIRWRSKDTLKNCGAFSGSHPSAVDIWQINSHAAISHHFTVVLRNLISVSQVDV